MWYKFHHYWRTHNIAPLKKRIKIFSRPNDIVLDSFMGSGTTVIESILLGRKAIGSDLNPFAVFLTKTILDEVDLVELKRSMQLISDIKNYKLSWHPKKIPFFIGNRVKLVSINNFLSKENLKTLSYLYLKINELNASEAVIRCLKLCFTSVLAQLVPRQRENEFVMESRDKTKKINLNGMFNKEYKKLFWIKKRMSNLVTEEDYRLFNLSASDLFPIKNESVDYVLIDPPYSEPYFNLSSFWCSWLGFKMNFSDEIMLTKYGFEKKFEPAVREIHRVLKRGRYFTVHYYLNLKPEIKESLLKIVKNSGFSLIEIKKKFLIDEILFTFQKN